MVINQRFYPNIFASSFDHFCFHFWFPFPLFPIALNQQVIHGKLVYDEVSLNEDSSEAVTIELYK